jgi:FAD/FMN-containing dehydrogenase
MPSNTRPSAALLDDLRAVVRGPVVGPADPEYDGARALMYGGLDKRPAAVARVADARDATAVVRYATAQEVPLSVRSGGHGVAGHAVVDGGIVIDLRALTGLELSPDGDPPTAWAGTGLTAGRLSTALAAHGLAVGFGDTGSVGVGGITLGGGIGYLVRKHGLTIDNLLAAEIVTADGANLMIDAEHHPDLFWAIRGGGANFGVATRFRFRLSPIPDFTGGLLVLPATAESVAGFLAAAESAPEELSAIANVMPCPPLPMVPEARHGRLVIFALMAVADGPAAADRVLAPFRSLGQPVADLVRPIPYPEIYPPEDPDYHPLAAARTGFMDRLEGPLAARLVEALETAEAPFRVAQLRVLGGAAARVPNDATAYAHRDRRILLNVAAFYEGPEDRAAREAWVDRCFAMLTGGDDAGYVNFLGDEGEARIRAAYPHGTYERLAAIKARYDPANVFRSNQNIPPAA